MLPPGQVVGIEGRNSCQKAKKKAVEGRLLTMAFEVI
jgi:hypothetical protein